MSVRNLSATRRQEFEPPTLFESFEAPEHPLVTLAKETFNAACALPTWHERAWLTMVDAIRDRVREESRGEIERLKAEISRLNAELARSLAVEVAP